MAFTKKEFEVLRNEISDVFNSIPVIKSNYNIKKSSYDWSSKHEWYINIEAYYITSLNRGKINPREKIEAVKSLLDTAYSFITENERNFEFLGIHSMKSPFAFLFIFQPKKDRVKNMLKRT